MDPITHKLSVKAAPEAAYAALATQSGIRDWWCKDSQVGETQGAASVLRFNKDDMPESVVMQFESATLEPGKRVVWNCTANDNPAWVGTRLDWQIAADGAGSSIGFTHDGWKEGGPLYDATVQGWQHFMNSLQSYLDGGEATPS